MNNEKQAAMDRTGELSADERTTSLLAHMLDASKDRRDLPTLPQSLINIIGEYGMARTDRVSPLEVQHRWELLIDGIKDYTAAQAPSRPSRCDGTGGEG